MTAKDSARTDADCAYCDADNGMYDFGRDCCLTRFVMSAPTKERRIAHLAYVERKVGEERTAMVKSLVEQAWAAQREKVFQHGRVKS